jgi:hypothetical protein
MTRARSIGPTFVGRGVLLASLLVVVACASPSPTPSLSLSTPSPAPSAAAVQPAHLATVLLDGLVQVADPLDPSRPFPSPRSRMEQQRLPLSSGQTVEVVSGPVQVDGASYWQVADSGFAGCCAAFGWVADTVNGKPTLSAMQPNCPDPSRELSPYDLVVLGPLAASVCYGSTDVSVAGTLTCSRPNADGAYSLGGAAWVSDQVWCYMGQPRVYGAAVTGLADAGGGFDGAVVVTGHYDEPSSSDCRWTAGSLMQFDLSDAPVATAQFACRTLFYVVEVSVS